MLITHKDQAPRRWAPSSSNRRGSALAALLLPSGFHDVGVAPGVVNVVPTGRPRTSDSACWRHNCRKVSFTGSTPVGRILLVAPRVACCTSMELGGDFSAFG